MKPYERQGVREPRDLSKWDTWKKYVIGTRSRFDPIEPVGGVQYGGQRYFFEEAAWPKGDGEPRIVAQVQPDFGTTDDDGRYLWSVSWEFGDGAWRDHGKIEGREHAKAKCLQIVAEGVGAALNRRKATRDATESVQQEAWPEYEPDVDDGAEWRQVKPKRTRSTKRKRAAAKPVEIYDDVPDE